MFPVARCLAAATLLVLTWSAALHAVDAPVEATGGGAPVDPSADFNFTRVGHNMGELVSELTVKMHRIQKKKDGAPPHLALVIDSSSSACRLLEELDKHIAGLMVNGPKGLQVSVIALRSQPAVVSPPAPDGKDLRRALRQVIEENKNAQIRAKLALNPAQRQQVQAWDNLCFITADDCVKDWCSGVRFCLKEFAKDYPVDAIGVFTLDNADTENDLEGLVGELTAAKATLIAMAPETMLTTSDPMPAGKRNEFYEKCKEALKIDYGGDFYFHRRESAINEVIPVSGLNGPVECVGNPTGWGYYGLSRAAYATNGIYLIIADNIHPQCACMFHAPGDRLMRGQARNGPIKPGPLPGAPGQKNEFKPIQPYEFDPGLQLKYQPCLLSRDEVFAVYQASPYYQYLFSHGHGNGNGNWRGNAWNGWNGNANNAHPWRNWGEGEYKYKAWHVTPWFEGGAKPPVGKQPKEEETYKQLTPLRIYSDDCRPPGAWNHDFGRGGGAAGGYAHFYTAAGVEAVKKWLETAIPAVQAHIETVRANMPQAEPTKHCHRAKAEIEYFIICLENQLFYLKQYRYWLDEMVKDPGVAAVFAENKNEEDVAKRLEEYRKNRKAGGGPGVSYIEIRMPRLLKQRCEDWRQVMMERPPIFGGGDGRAGLERFVNAKTKFTENVGQSTWLNFYNLGWQRQYGWVRITPSPGGPGGRVPPPKIPVPPTYQQPPSPTAPSY